MRKQKYTGKLNNYHTKFNSDNCRTKIKSHFFSAPFYCGEFDNSAGIMIIDEALTCSLKVLRPVENLNR